MTALEYRSATLPDCYFVGNNLRQADQNEIRSLGKDPVESIVSGYVYGDICLAAVADGEPIAILGRVPVLKNPKIASVWMVGTEGIFTHRYKVLRDSRVVLGRLFTGFDALCNHVDSRNELHIKWLRWLGFSFLRSTSAISVDGTVYYEFAKVNHV